MPIKLTLIPDGLSQLPVEATDDTVLAHHLENSGYADWRAVERRISGGSDTLGLHLSGGMDDYQQSDLDTISQSITSNISGLKAHPAGWQPADEP